MSKDSKNTLFKVNAEEVLIKGLEAMTKSCEGLTKQNDILNNDVENLKKKINFLQDRLITNSEERE